MSSQNEQRKPGPIQVPGGVIWVDLKHGRNPFMYWVLVLLHLPLRDPKPLSLMKRDVVISDENRERELYREGPYDEFSVGRHLDAVVREVEREGLQVFLRRRQVEDGSIGRISVSSGEVDLTKWTEESARFEFFQVKQWANKLRGR
jgi:hypothetical protein